MCQPAGATTDLLELLQFLQKLFAASAGAVLASTEANAASAGAVFWCFQLSLLFWKIYLMKF